jgi:riboflavin kinase/FMN adenylyltransferase
LAEKIEKISDLKRCPSALRGAVLAVGNFDGVHRGHRAVLERALALAAQHECPAMVLTFEPHPRQFFRPDAPLFRISSGAMKQQLLGKLGFDGIVELAFNKDFASLTADEFVNQVLMDGLGIRHVVTGVDFHFGKNRQGGPAFLMASGAKHGFGVELVDSFRDEGAEVISSSRIRELLASGDLAEANGLLGYRYTIEGEVVHGQQLGRTLGFPTANMALPASNDLKHGIYAVRLRRADGSLHDGVASFGRRPTVETDGAPLLETFVFDFSGDLYGEVCQVSFFGYLRGEEKFSSLDALNVQMRRDEAEARALLAGVTPLSDLDKAVSF